MEQGTEGMGAAEELGAHVLARREGGMLNGAFSLPANSAAARYLEDVYEGGARRRAHPVEVPSSQPVGPREHMGPAPFLSVVLRTQGKRVEELSDVLLCLMAQRDDDFEVVVVGHKVAPEAYEPLMGLLRSFPDSITCRMRYLAVDHGTRTTPLQVGFAAARGRYVCALDDDDLVMDTWVSGFKELAERDGGANDGKVLQSFVVTQDWRVLPATAGTAEHVLESSSWFGDGYCRPFDAASQLFINGCPLMGLAFPRYLVAGLGYDFDEEITTTEDWDFLMRAYSVCGVASREEVSSVYRLWTNTETSHTLHDQREWDRNYARIVDKMNSRPYLLDAGAVEDIRSKSAEAPVSRESLVLSALVLAFEKPLSRKAVWDEVSMAHGAPSTTGKKEPQARRVAARLGEGGADLAFDMEGVGPVSMLAFAPLPSAFRVLGDFTMRVVGEDGSRTELDFQDSAFTNGFQVDCNHIVYLMEDPFVAFSFEKPVEAERVELTFKLLASVPDYYIGQVTRGKAGLMAGRARRWLYRKLHERR